MAKNFEKVPIPLGRNEQTSSALEYTPSPLPSNFLHKYSLYGAAWDAVVPWSLGTSSSGVRASSCGYIFVSSRAMLIWLKNYTIKFKLGFKRPRKFKLGLKRPLVSTGFRCLLRERGQGLWLDFEHARFLAPTIQFLTKASLAADLAADCTPKASSSLPVALSVQQGRCGRSYGAGWMAPLNSAIATVETRSDLCWPSAGRHDERIAGIPRAMADRIRCRRGPLGRFKEEEPLYAILIKFSNFQKFQLGPPTP
ncbi:hypothetical protein VNO77_03407 [Canavalia gladiata]|uniref:Uncharacterized protein n=1 Tax=Canavalia gladiata TaxID=3824 RepID=A0AAN9RC78_CANGL